MKELKPNLDDVNVYNAFVGMPIRIKYSDVPLEGIIHQISGFWQGVELHSHKCIVRYMAFDKDYFVANIGYNNKFDLKSLVPKGSVTIRNVKTEMWVYSPNHNAHGQVISFDKDNMACTVKFISNINYVHIVNIGYEGEFNLLIMKNEEYGNIRKENKTNKNKKINGKATKIARLVPKIRQGDRQEATAIKSRAFKAKCYGIYTEN